MPRKAAKAQNRKPARGRPSLFQNRRLLSVTLEQSDYESLLQLARGVGMGASTYVRMLIKRAIQELPQQSSP
jgi:hypothetical protein